MQIIGLLGGIASGKSTVARMLAEHGAAVLDADAAAHAALGDPEVLSALRERFSENLFDDTGALVRRRLAERVFGASPEHEADRRFLEGLIHPRVRERLRQQLAELSAAGQGVAVLDIPLLLEAGWAEQCDVLLMVDTPQRIRLEQAAERGWSADELARREDAQTSVAEKRRLANVVLANDGGVEELRQGVAEFWAQRFGGGVSSVAGD